MIMSRILQGHKMKKNHAYTVWLILPLFFVVCVPSASARVVLLNESEGMSFQVEQTAKGLGIP